MFKGYDPDKKPPYTQVVYHIIGEKIYKTLYHVVKGYADSFSITSNSTLVEEIPSNAIIEVHKWKIYYQEVLITKF